MTQKGWRVVKHKHNKKKKKKKKNSKESGSFTMANSNSFLSLYEILLLAQENK